MRVANTIGNAKLWEQQKKLFLCSRHASLACYKTIFQWVESLDKGDCTVCFNTSELEEEVLKALLVCRVPTILVVTGRFLDIYNVQIEQALKERRLLIMELQREESDGKGYIARLRNQYIISHVQHIVCGPIDPNGSIYGLLAGKNNVTYLVNRKELKAAEGEAKPFRWTVAEDKRLLRMFYEDMGIHAIHKALNRPYSTVYQRIKALSMNDEVLKGRQFEDYVVAIFDLPHNEKLTLKEWRGDKTLPGIYPENNSAPDLVFSYDGHPFAIECKWRSHMPKDIVKDLLPTNRQAFFQQYSKEKSMPVYLLLGIGGLPSDPENLYLASFDETLSATTLFQNPIFRTTDILQHILPIVKPKPLVHPIYPLQKPTPQHIQKLRERYPNAYKPWSTKDDEQLQMLFSEGKNIYELVDVFKRNAGGIKSRLRKLKLI